MKPSLELTINGRSHALEADEDTPLLAVLRNHLGLRAARFGCGHEQCGACMVLVDGEPVYSCTRPASSVVGKTVLTVEGMGTPDQPHALQQAFLAEQAGQCGYCLSGMLISAKALLDRNSAPSRDEVVQALDPHLCRCGAHPRIMRAIERAAVMLRGGAGA